MLGEPQTIAVARQGVTVRADSPARFTRIVLDTGVARETWIRAVDFKPSDPRVVRAAFFTVIETEEYLGGWTPWHSSTELPDGVAFRLPPRARIAVEMASTFGWDRYVGLDGRIIARADFGASAPLKDLLKEFGFTVEHIVAEAKALVGRK